MRYCEARLVLVPLVLGSSFFIACTLKREMHLDEFGEMSVYIVSSLVEVDLPPCVQCNASQIAHSRQIKLLRHTLQNDRTLADVFVFPTQADSGRVTLLFICNLCA